MNQLVYKNLVTSVGTNPYLCESNGNLHVLVTVYSEDLQWIDLYLSYDNGETWINDTYLPPDIYRLSDPKMIAIGDAKYIFAHGKNEYNVDTIRFIKYAIYKDDVYAWDDEWKDLFEDYVYDARVTDLKVNREKTRIYIAYDKMKTTGKYGSYFAIYSIDN